MNDSLVALVTGYGRIARDLTTVLSREVFLEKVLAEEHFAGNFLKKPPGFWQGYGRGWDNIAREKATRNDYNQAMTPDGALYEQQPLPNCGG